MASPNSQIAAELWPQILRRLERWQRNVGTGGGSSGTVTVEFTGTVTDEQAPQFLLRDGSRSLQGNLAVDSGITIDGIDISAHAADSSAHHAPVTAGDGIGVTGQSVAVNSTVVRTTRTVSAGDGLSGGGDLSANRSFAVDSTVVRTTRTLSAGDGLSGGGDLSANRSFAVSLATDPGLEFSSGALRAKIVTGDMTRTASGLGVNRAIAPTWTGIHMFNANPVIANNLSFTGARTINSNSTNALTLAPGGELVLDPGTTVTMAAGHEFRSATFSDLVTGIAGFRAWDRGSNLYQLTIGGLKADELFARVFVADETRIDRGEEFWSKSYGVVETAFTLPAVSSTVDVWFEDAPSITGDIFSTGDWLLIRAVDWATGLVLSAVWFDITARVTASSGGRQRWRLRRQSGGTTGQTIKAGSVALDFGQSGQGWVHVNALSSGGGPFVQVGTWAGANPYTPANVTNRVRMGHLSGAAGFGSGDYGFAAGNDLGLTPATGFQGFTAEATDGAALYNTDVQRYDGSTLRYTLGEAGLFMYPPSSASPTTSGVTWYDASDDRIGVVAYSPNSGDGTLYLISDIDPGASPKTGTDTVYIGSGIGASGASLQLIADHDTTDYRLDIGTFVIDAESAYMGLGVAPSTTAQLDVVSGAAGRHALRLKAAASPTVPTFEIENSSGDRMFAFSDDYVAQVGSVYRVRYSVPSGLNGSNTLRIDLTMASNTAYLTRIDLHVGRGGAVALWGTLTGFIAWNGTTSGNGAVRDNQLRAYGQGATGSISTSGITNGIRIDVTFTGLTNDTTFGEAILTSFGANPTVSISVV